VTEVAEHENTLVTAPSVTATSTILVTFEYGGKGNILQYAVVKERLPGVGFEVNATIVGDGNKIDWAVLN
jgi:hypothetical protein